MKLFEIEPTNPTAFCRTCEHRERHQCNSKVFQYCGVLKSSRTENGKLKIKCKTPACSLYKAVLNKNDKSNDDKFSREL